MKSACLFVLLVFTISAAASPPPEEFFADVRDYLPEPYVTDGSVDYREQIQKCLNENSSVYFPGSNDHRKPFVYGCTGTITVRPFTVIRFGPNAILKRMPHLKDWIILGRGARLIGAVIDGNKYAHWPLVKDRPIKPYVYSIGHCIEMRGQNVLEDCFIYNHPGIAFGAWNVNDNKLYRCRAENCGFIEALGERSWRGEYASADGFFFWRSHNNLVKDCEAIDCTRWGYVVESLCSDNTFVDCRGGNLHFSSLGFFDVESSGPGNSLMRCRSRTGSLTIQDYHQDAYFCSAGQIIAEHASYPRIIGCTTAGGCMRLCEIREGRVVMRGRASPMLAGNRVFMRGTGGGDQSLTVICPDGLGIATDNLLYGFREGARHSADISLEGVPVREGNLVGWGTWVDILDGFPKPNYLRAHMDFDFKKRYEQPGTEETK